MLSLYKCNQAHVHECDDIEMTEALKLYQPNLTICKNKLLPRDGNIMDFGTPFHWNISMYGCTALLKCVLQYREVKWLPRNAQQIFSWAGLGKWIPTSSFFTTKQGWLVSAFYSDNLILNMISNERFFKGGGGKETCTNMSRIGSDIS